MANRLKLRKPKLPRIPGLKRAEKYLKNDIPGTLTYTGDKEKMGITVEVIDYAPHQHKVSEAKTVDIAFHKHMTNEICWINTNGLRETEQIEKLGSHYHLHPLILEDIVDINQRPKIDEYPDYLFIVFKMLYYNSDNEFINEHVSLVLGQDYVITFQESDGDIFDSLRQRIANSKGRIRTLGSDYLMFAILDAVVDHYMTLTEALSDRIENLEDILFLNNNDKGYHPGNTGS